MPSPEFETFARLLDGQYALDREIGRGGMGVVYLARDVKLDRRVAIKTLPPNLAGDAQIRERFLREARTAAALSHPNIVPIYRADEIGGHVFFVMGYVDGESVGDLVRQQRRLDPREVLHIMRDVASALGYAAAHGVVHRDVKAENILIDRRTGTAMVTDFGIARLAEAKPLTATGQVLGTVYYMSPEQVSGGAIDGRSDLYALGVVGFFTLTGRFPFDAQLASAVLVAQVMTPAPAVLTVAPDAPRSLAEIIDRCLAKDPAIRYQTGDELAAALQAVSAEVARDATRAVAVAAANSTLLSDSEAEAIWKRAAELQSLTGIQPRGAPIALARDRDADASRTSGYALDDVRAAAAEAGIPAQYVDHAMAERGLVAVGGGALAPVEIRDLKSGDPWLAGGPMSVEFEAVLPGEVSEREFDFLADTIRRKLREAGAVSGTSRSLTWNTLNRNRSLHVSVYARGGKTTIRAVETMGNLAGGLFGGIIGGAGGGMSGAMIGISMRVFHNPAAAILLEAGWLVAMYGLARTIFARRSGKRKETLRELVSELAEQVRDSMVGGATPALQPGGSPARNP